MAVAAASSACGRVDFDAIGDAFDTEGAPDVAADDLVAWYEMKSLDDAGDHHVLVDITGHGHDATCTTACPTVAAGRWGNGLAFDGSQIVQAASANDLRLTTGFTIASWLRVDITPPAAYGMQPLTKTFGPDIRDSWAFAIESDLSTVIFADAPTTPQSVPDTRAITLGAWHHIAFRWDGAQFDCLIDGAVDESGPITDIGWDDGPVNLGADFESAGPCCGLTGALDDVRIYRRALTDAEVAVLAQ
jgi:sialidase-1